MPFIRDLLGNLNSVINPATTGPTNPNAGVINQNVPSMGMQQPVPNMFGMGDAYERGPVSTDIYPTPILDRYQQELTDIPEWRKPNLLRMLMTGAYSALQKTPDEVQESVDEKGNVRRVTKKGHWDPFDYGETDKILNHPNYRDIDLWKMRTDALGKGAGVENSINNNRSLAAQRFGNLDVANRKVDQNERALDIKLMDAQTRARVAALKDLPDSEKLRLLNENKITIEELRASSRYSVEELRGKNSANVANINQAGANARNAASIQGAMDRVNANNEADLEEINARGEQARQTKGTPSANAGVNSQLPSQQKTALINKTNQLLNANPSWRKYVTADPDTGLPVIDRPGSWGGPDQAIYDKINEALYGTSTSIPTNTTTPGKTMSTPTGKTSTDPTKQVTNQPFKFDPSIHPVTKDGKVGIRDKQGNLFSVDPKLVDKYIAQGYTVVTAGGK